MSEDQTSSAFFSPTLNIVTVLPEYPNDFYPLVKPRLEMASGLVYIVWYKSF